MSASDDRDRGTVREIRCRDRLWQTFEQMSEEQEKSVEELINDAMTGYAQIAGYETARSRADARAHAGPAAWRPTAAVHSARARRAWAAPPPPRRRAPRGGPPPVPEGGGGTAMLYLVFDNQKYRIDKDQFIIGRGTKSSDLPIKDGNISRKHAAVIRRNGTFFIKDLGSTNGIDFNGMRIDNKRIDEGDVFHICEYELKFTYRR